MDSVSDFFARSQTAFFRFFADTFFAKRYVHRAVVLETVAAVPGMVGGALQHLRSLRSMENDDSGWIQTLRGEAEALRNQARHMNNVAQDAEALAERIEGLRTMRADCGRITADGSDSSTQEAT